MTGGVRCRSIRSCSRYELMYVLETADETRDAPHAGTRSSAGRLCRIPLIWPSAEESELRLRLLAGFPAVLEVRASSWSGALIVICIGPEAVDDWIDAVKDLLEEAPASIERTRHRRPPGPVHES
ncbi:MAG TPA: hypothetical protein VMP89_19955 [Solirubrobacteraceae bacterium]|nr:hypothetical protein [Solirubrobacteraceae bacterium]